jgi:hypothetical protein
VRTLFGAPLGLTGVLAGGIGSGAAVSTAFTSAGIPHGTAAATGQLGSAVGTGVGGHRGVLDGLPGSSPVGQDAGDNALAADALFKGIF